MSKKNPKRQCPKHRVKMERKKTRFGPRFSCPVPGCTIACWGNGNPADDETRQARIDAHAAFDPLWQGGGMSKGHAYRDLSEYMGLPQRKTHIGCFDIEQCRLVLAFCEEKDHAKTNPINAG